MWQALPRDGVSSWGLGLPAPRDQAPPLLPGSEPRAQGPRLITPIPAPQALDTSRLPQKRGFHRLMRTSE